MCFSARRYKMKKIFNKRGVLLLFLVIFICLFVIAKFEINSRKVKIYGCDKNKIDVVCIWANDSEIYTDSYQTEVFTDGVQLKYFLRSLDVYLPWINNIFIITYDKIPSWINLKNTKIKLISFRKILNKGNDSSVYTKTSVLSKLHRLKDLSECYIYFEDSTFPLESIYVEDFYTNYEGYKIYLGEIFGKCSSKCYWSQVNNNVCDLYCYNKECKYDGNDCKDIKKTKKKYVNARIEEKEIINYPTLVHTDKILNHYYGFNLRRMYQNIPILIQKNIVKNMFNSFVTEFEQSFNNKSEDLDFTFLYHQYIINEKLSGNVSTIFDYFDTNKDGYWSNEEIFDVFFKLFHYKQEDMSYFDNYYMKCCEFLKFTRSCNKNFQILNEYYASIFSQIDKEIVLCCQSLTDFLINYYQQLNKYQHKIINENNVLDVKFNSDLVNIIKKINESEKKFLHIIITSKDMNSKDIRSSLLNFYNVLFPSRSQYELDPGEVNPYKNMAEFQIWSHINKINYALIIICSTVFMIVTLSCIKMYISYRYNKVGRFKL